MKTVTVEITGSDSARVDEATSELLDRLKQFGVDVKPAFASGERDGGIVAISFALLGGAASIAQVASTIHSMRRKPAVHVIVVDATGRRTAIADVDQPADLEKIIGETVDRS